MSKILIALVFLGMNFYIYGFLATEEVIPARETFDGFPLELGEWRCPALAEMDPRAQKFLGAAQQFGLVY